MAVDLTDVPKLWIRHTRLSRGTQWKAAGAEIARTRRREHALTVLDLGGCSCACRINTTIRYALYGSALLLIVIACIAFWSASRNEPLLFSLDATRAVAEHPKSMTFVWTLIGTVLAFITGTVFNQLLKLSGRLASSTPSSH